MFILLFKTHLFKMKLNAVEHEFFRKHLEIYFVMNPNLKNIVKSLIISKEKE